MKKIGKAINIFGKIKTLFQKIKEAVNGEDFTKTTGGWFPKKLGKAVFRLVFK